MEMRCPGSSGVLRPTIELLPCPKCGKDVEIFTDETKAECECGGVVYRDLSSCVQWCSFAEKCVGEEKLKELKKK